MKKKYQRDKHTKKHNYISNFITRVLLSIIVFFSILIYTNNKDNLKTFKKYAIDTHFSFAKINKVYNKYLKVIVPTKEKSITAFKEEDTSLKAYENGYIKDNQDNDVNALKEGIIVNITKDYFLVSKPLPSAPIWEFHSRIVKPSSVVILDRKSVV